MWLYCVKKEINDDKAVYTYGYATKKQTGIIEYSFREEKIFIRKKADSDIGDDGSYTLQHLYGRFYNNMKSRNFEDEFMLAFG